MKKLITAIALLTTLTTSLVAHANEPPTYDFSYTFDSTHVLTGSFSGTNTSDYFTDVANFHMSMNGSSIPGVFTAYGTDDPEPFLTVGGNNSYIDIFTPGKTVEFEILGYPTNIYIKTPGFTKSNVAFNAENWTLALAPVAEVPPVAAVPEPETYAMLLAGLGALGFVARRRQSL